MSKFRVVATTRLGRRRLVLHTGSGYSWRRGQAAMTVKQAAGARRWANRRRARTVDVLRKGQWAFLSKNGNTEWPKNRRLLRKLNRVGRRRRLRVHIVSGQRTPWQAWQLRMNYLHNGSPLAARCCSRFDGVHSWADCGKDPWSNHADGNAADCGLILRSGRYQSIGLDRRARRLMRRLRLCLPVGHGEVWHVEIGNTWAS